MARVEPAYADFDHIARQSQTRRWFAAEDRLIYQATPRADGTVVTSAYAHALGEATGDVSRECADQRWLQSTTRPRQNLKQGDVAVLDLFSGAGGLSLGVKEAASSLGMRVQATAFDIDPVALGVYQENFPEAAVFQLDIGHVLSGTIGEPPTESERRFAESFGEVSLLAGGPPCQGHSAANNRTRHSDERNGLLLKVVRAAELLGSEHVLMENVPGAIRDRGKVVQTASRFLKELGYHVDVGVVDAADLGVAQSRRRLLIAGSKVSALDVQAVVSEYSVPPRSVSWAIRDLAGLQSSELIDHPANSAQTTRERIAYLFDNDLYELPDSERPPCHSRGEHSYRSIYGRLRPEGQAQTITTGFYSMCMGRYVHPSLPRTITAHEAARLQGLPDFFTWSSVSKRGDLARLIGNAVPPALVAPFVMDLLK